MLLVFTLTVPSERTLRFLLQSVSSDIDASDIYFDSTIETDVFIVINTIRKDAFDSIYLYYVLFISLSFQSTNLFSVHLCILKLRNNNNKHL